MITQQESTVLPIEEDPSFWKLHWQKFVALAFWVILLVSYGWYYTTNNLTPSTAVLEIVDLLKSPYGPLLYILVYALRPLIFFSAVVLTLAGGSIFGAGGTWNLVWAVVLTFIASHISATVAYLIGRYFGEGLIKENVDQEENMIQRYAGRMRRNSFETVMVMRFIFLPYDLVNYLAGFLRIDWKSFILATFVGSIPGTIAFVSFGASIDIAELANGTRPELDPWTLGFGVAIFIASIAISRYFKRQEAERDA